MEVFRGVDFGKDDRVYYTKHVVENGVLKIIGVNEMTSKEMYQALLAGKEITDGTSNYKLNGQYVYIKNFYTNHEFVKVKTSDSFSIVEPIKVKEGQVYALKDSCFIVVKTGETTLRLVNQTTWTTDGKNYYGWTKEQMERSGFLCVNSASM